MNARVQKRPGPRGVANQISPRRENLAGRIWRTSVSLATRAAIWNSMDAHSACAEEKYFRPNAQACRSLWERQSIVAGVADPGTNAITRTDQVDDPDDSKERTCGTRQVYSNLPGR